MSFRPRRGPGTSRPLFWTGMTLLGVLLSAAVFGDGGLIDLWKLHRERDRTAERLFLLAHQNDRLRQRILDVLHSDQTLERLARRELGLVRDGEIVYRFPPAQSTPGR